jgi:hypothetical protein
MNALVPPLARSMLHITDRNVLLNASETSAEKKKGMK